MPEIFYLDPITSTNVSPNL